MVGVVMGSMSDWKWMAQAVRLLNEFGVPNEYRVVSAHRTPDLLYEYAKAARGRGLKAVIAGAGGAAHLPGMLAALTSVPVLGVPLRATAPHLLDGLDAMLSIAQMPRGVPTATFAVNGAQNAALFAVAMLANEDAALLGRLEEWRRRQTEEVLAQQPMLGGEDGATT